MLTDLALNLFAAAWLTLRALLHGGPMPLTGRFLSLLKVVLQEDNAHNGQGLWSLLDPLVYEAYDGRRFEVPAGFTTDFASVPRLPIAYAIAGNRAHRAATLHDYLIREKVVPRKRADDIFYEAMLATGVEPFAARAMHLAVRSYTDSLEPPGDEGRGHEFV